MGQPTHSEEMGSLLRELGDAIGELWTDRLVEKFPGNRYAETNREEVLAWTGRAIGVFSECLSSGSEHLLDTYIDDLVRTRSGLGFRIEEVVSALLLFREAALPVLVEKGGRSSDSVLLLMPGLDRLLRRVIGRFSRQFAEAMTRSLEEEKRRTSLLLEMAEAAGGSLDFTLVLERVAGGIASALGFPYCGILLVGDEMREFLLTAEVGRLPDKAEIRRVLNASIGSLESPLVAEALQRKEPACSDELSPGPVLEGRPIEALGVGAVCCLPILMAGRVLAIALAVHDERDGAGSPERMALAWGITNAVAPSVENARLYAESQRQLAESQSLQQVTAALLAKQELGEVLEIVCRETMQLSGAKGSAILLRNEDETMTVAFSLGVARQWGDRLLDMLPFPDRHPIPTELVLTGAGAAPDPDSRQDELHSALVFPLLVGGASIGALVLINKRGGFQERDLHILATFADQGAIAIEQARLIERHERLAVLEERQKIARELHDSVTQSLYGVTMFAEAASRLLAAGQTETAGTHLQDLRETALDALKQMRLLIHELRPSVLKEEGLIAALENRLLAVEGRAGVETVFVHSRVDRLPREVEEEIYSFARESLNNILKHAHASRVSMALRGVSGGVILDIVDDGVGFVVDEGKRAGGLGLVGMEERASRLGGA